MLSLMNWESVCIICLQKGENRVIFEQDNDFNVIADKIMKCADILIKRDSNHPKNICLQCLDDLNVAYKFRRNCEQSDSIIKELLNANNHIKDLWNKTPSTTNPTLKICIKDENVVEATVDSDCNDEGTPCLDLKDDPDTEAKIVRDQTEDCTHGNAIKLNNVKVSQSNKTKQEANCDTVRQSKTLLEGSIAKPILKSAYKRPLKICEICNHCFRGQNTLNIHMRRLNDERPFNCEHCDKAFVTASDLQRHIRGHTGQRPYKCQYCDRRFSNYAGRKNHERTHTGERPFACPICGKSFAYSHVLSDHRRIHTGVKKFMCEECGKGFDKRVLLERHVARHLSRDKSDKSQYKQKKLLEKEIFQIEECANSNEINIKHEVKLIEERLN